MGGMSEGLPETFTIIKTNENYIFDVNEFLNKNTFKVVDFRTGEDRILKLGLSPTKEYNMCELHMVEDVIFNAGFNYMLYQTENNVFLFIDDKKFQQR